MGLSRQHCYLLENLRAYSGKSSCPASTLTALSEQLEVPSRAALVGRPAMGPAFRHSNQAYSASQIHAPSSVVSYQSPLFDERGYGGPPIPTVKVGDRRPLSRSI